MLVCWPGNEYCWYEGACCRNAGCSELYIVHLLDSFAVIALQHNSGTALVPRVSALHYLPPHPPPSSFKPPRLLNVLAQMERSGEGANGGFCTHADGVVAFIKERRPCPLALALLALPHSRVAKRSEVSSPAHLALLEMKGDRV